MVAPIKTKQPKAQGYIKDLAYLKLALGFFKTALNDLKEEKPNKFYKENQKITRRIENLVDSKEIVYSNVNNQDQEKSNSYANKLILSLMKIAPQTETINLELTAIYILYCRFMKSRQKPLHTDFNFYADEKRLFDLADLISEVDVAGADLEYKTALQLVKVL